MSNTNTLPVSLAMAENASTQQDLNRQIDAARKIISTDGYEMSVGEIMNLYRDGEMIIRPEYQRLFRWKMRNKARFIESLLLGIPIPPIFVSQLSGGAWELIDGLQRISTILEFSGLLSEHNPIALSDYNKSQSEDEESEPPFASSAPLCLTGTNLLPALSGKAWESHPEQSTEGIGRSAQILIKRARLRVEILKTESDPGAKYEVFQRLNTGGAPLVEQEVRNCVAISINPAFQHWLEALSVTPDFVKTVDLSENSIKQQLGVELVLRFIAFTVIQYQRGLDVHEYLDKALLVMANNKDFDREVQGAMFKRVFYILNQSLGSGAFKKWNGERFAGRFLHSLFEVLTVGVASQLDRLEAMNEKGRNKLLLKRSKELWSNPEFRQNSGAGIGGTTRLSHLLPIAVEYLKP